MRRLLSLARDRRGATLVEFALILVPLCVLLLGALDLGYQVYLRSVMQGVLNDVARTASVENPTISASGTTLEAKIEQAIKDRVNVVARNATYDIKQRSFFEFSRVGRPEKLLTDVDNDGQFDTGDCFEDFNKNGTYDTHSGQVGRGGAEDVIFYDVEVTMPRLVPMDALLDVPANYEIAVTAAVRTQPYTDRNLPPTVCAE